MRVTARAFFAPPDELEDLVAKAVELATAARKGGLLSLESIEIPNAFLKKGIQLVVDGLDPDVVRRTLMKDLQQTVQRHQTGKKFFMALGEVAPAMGMIGTLVGLVQMLTSMDDPKSIGPAMAVALLTTLYGAVIANVIALPLADKLAMRSQQELLTKSLAIDAISGIQNGQNPRLLEDMLRAYLPRVKVGTEDASAS